jgi:hypothetical protein
MFNNFFPKIAQFMKYEQKKYGTAGQVTGDSTAHELFMLDN